MIWLVLVAAVFVLGGAWFIAKSMPTRIAILVTGIAAVAGYWILGKPDMGDRPLGQRIQVLETAAAESPDSVTPEQYLVIRQDRARKSPSDPVPLKEIGDLYFTNGRFDEARTAYRSALLRDPNYRPAADAMSELFFMETGEIDPATQASLPAIRARAQTNPESLTSVQVLALINERLVEAPEDATAFRMKGDIYASIGRLEQAEAAYRSASGLQPTDRLALEAWADARFKSSQKVDPETADLYLRAYQLDKSDLRVGYMAGIGLWLQGKTAQAEAMWKDIDARAPDGGPERQMFAALRQMFGVDPASPDSGGNSPE